VTDSALSTTGLTVRLALTVAPPPDAVIVTGVMDVTVPAVAVNVAEVDPCTTVTEAGTVAAAFELDSVTVIPPVGAGAAMVTVP
jgi:hypothetical protein